MSFRGLFERVQELLGGKGPRSAPARAPGDEAVDVVPLAEDYPPHTVDPRAVEPPEAPR